MKEKITLPPKVIRVVIILYHLLFNLTLNKTEAVLYILIIITYHVADLSIYI